MTHSPRADVPPEARRGSDAGPEQWLELPGWRKPLDTLLVLAVTFSAAWLGLVVIPAAANDGETPVADETVVASAPTADETTDPGQWVAGPVYTGGPAAAAPTTAAATERGGRRPRPLRRRGTRTASRAEADDVAGRAPVDGAAASATPASAGRPRRRWRPPRRRRRPRPSAAHHDATTTRATTTEPPSSSTETTTTDSTTSDHDQRPRTTDHHATATAAGVRR